MKIADLQLPNNRFLAPMAGVTDVVFRALCKENGCGLTYTEMISAKGLCYGSKKTRKMLDVFDEESPAAVQIFGRDPNIMAKACEFFNENDDICLIDINMGCPVPKVIKKGEGVALMKNPKAAAEIVREVKKATEKPVTVKCRKGFSLNDLNVVDFARELEQAGVDGICVHGRTGAQVYSDKADWDIIRQVKESVKIPVIGNGDIFTGKDALRMIETTGCDAVMIGRGALGNPWIFTQVHQALSGQDVISQDASQRIDMFLNLFRRSILHYGEERSVIVMRRHLSWFIKGMKNSSRLRGILLREKRSDKIFDVLREYKEQLT